MHKQFQSPFLASNDRSVWRDLFTVAGLGRAVVMPAELSFSVGCEWADMMALYCRNVAKEDSEFERRIGVLLQEMEAAYDEREDFIKELEDVPGVDVAIKTAKFLNDALWKDERRLQRLHKLWMDADLMAYKKEKFTQKL
ncbi:hypothetical protein Tco_0018893 [Tanacetum coccineum]